jgi:Putative inner membrane exporter, YdcZ
MQDLILQDFANMPASLPVGFIAWALVAGGLIPVLAALSGGRGRAIAGPIHAPAISMAVGLVVSLVVLLGLRPATPAAETLKATPAWLHLGERSPPSMHSAPQSRRRNWGLAISWSAC